MFKSEIELKFATHIPSGHIRWQTVTGPWTKMIEERTGGKNKNNPPFEESLMKSNDSWEDLKQGVADMAAYHTARMPGRFSLADMAVKPGLGLTGLILELVDYNFW